MPFDMDDLRALQAEKKTAWAKAYDVLWQAAVSAAAQHMGAYFPQHVEDVASDALHTLQQKGIHQCKGPGGIISFVRRIAKFKALDFVKRGVNHTLARLETEHIKELQADDDDGEQAQLSPRLDYFANELCLSRVGVDLVIGALVCVLKLSNLDEWLLREHIVGTVNQREFAEKYGVSINGVGARKMRILRKIKRHLQSRPRLQRIRKEIERRHELE